MTNLFNNREIATGIWLVIAAVWAGRRAGIREAFSKLPKAFFHWKIVTPIFLMAGYLSLEVWLLRQCKLWNMSLLKDTIYWFFLTGFVLLMTVMGEKENISFFRKTAIGCVAATVFIQFLLNLYTFPLWSELLFIPVTAILAIMTTIAESDKNLEPARKLFDGIISIIGLILVVYLIRMTWLHHSELSASSLLLSILLPILLTLLFFPFLYIAKLVANYEMFFIRLKLHISNDANLLKYTRAKTLQHCHVNLPRLDRFERFLLDHVWDTRDRDGINRIITNFKSGQNYDC